MEDSEDSGAFAPQQHFTDGGLGDWIDMSLSQGRSVSMIRESVQSPQNGSFPPMPSVVPSSYPSSHSSVGSNPHHYHHSGSSGSRPPSRRYSNQNTGRPQPGMLNRVPTGSKRSSHIDDSMGGPHMRQRPHSFSHGSENGIQFKEEFRMSPPAQKRRRRDPDSDDGQDSEEGAHASGSNSGNNSSGRRTSSNPEKSSERPRLTEQEKKTNHIASEQKRRMAIREGFDRLTEIVPGLEGQGRSESIVLKKSVDYIRGALDERRRLLQRIQDLGGEIPKDMIPR